MNCEKCGNPKSKILLFQFEEWICKPCEVGVGPPAYTVWYNVVGGSDTNPWRTLEKCFVDAGSQFPFEIEYRLASTIYNRNNLKCYTLEDLTIISKDGMQWKSQSNCFWQEISNQFRLYKCEK